MWPLMVAAPITAATGGGRLNKPKVYSPSIGAAYSGHQYSPARRILAGARQPASIAGGGLFFRHVVAGPEPAAMP